MFARRILFRGSCTETHAKFPSTRSLLRLSEALNVEVHELFKPPRGQHRNSLKKLYDIAALRESLKNEVIELVNQKFTWFFCSYSGMFRENQWRV